MTERVDLHPQNPQPRRLQTALAALVRGGLIAYPTDSGYALGWRADNRRALEKVRRFRQLSKQHNFTYICRSLADVGQYAKLENWAHRMIRQLAPGPYTFILNASGQVPRHAREPKRRTIGIRIPEHPVVQALLTGLDEPLLSSSLITPELDADFPDVEDVYNVCDKVVDVFLDIGWCTLEPTSVIDLTGAQPVVVRHGSGPVDFLFT